MASPEEKAEAKREADALLNRFQAAQRALDIEVAKRLLTDNAHMVGTDGKEHWNREKIDATLDMMKKKNFVWSFWIIFIFFIISIYC